MKNTARDNKAKGYIREAIRKAEHINQWEKGVYKATSRRQQNEFYKRDILFSLRNALTLLENKR